jgi:hypothetical protein
MVSLCLQGLTLSFDKAAPRATQSWRVGANLTSGKFTHRFPFRWQANPGETLMTLQERRSSPNGRIRSSRRINGARSAPGPNGDGSLARANMFDGTTWIPTPRGVLVMSQATSNDLRILMTGLVFGESPRWHDGRLWFVDFSTTDRL